MEGRKSADVSIYRLAPGLKTLWVLTKAVNPGNIIVTL